jgi:hypothetical protein
MKLANEGIEAKESVLYLQNKKVRFGFERATGSVVRIESLANGQQYMREPSRGRLFRVMCPTARWMGRYADSHEAMAPRVEQSESKLSFFYPGLKAGNGEGVDVSARVEVELPPDSQEAFFALEITNNSPDRLQEIRFPWIGAGLQVEGRTDRFLLGTGEWRGLYPDPAEEFAFNLWNHHRRGCYPSFIPFLDMSNHGRGLSYISYHKEPVVVKIVCENLEQEPGGGSLSFAWVYFPFILPGQTWRSPRVGIGVHQGDWHATADHYRAWADTWWKPPATPARLKTSIGFQNIQLHRADGLGLYRYRDIPRLAEAGRKYGVNDLCLWTLSHFGLYIRPEAWEGSELLDECDPAYSSEELRWALAEAKKLGVNVSALVNFRLIQRESAAYCTFGEENVMRTVFGAPALDEYSDCSATHAGPRTSYLARHSSTLCQKTPWFRERSRDLVRRLIALGYTSVFIDQASDNHQLCFAPGHGHGSPDDVSGYEACSEAVALFRHNDPDAYVIGENLDVFFSGIIDVNWCWSWNNRSFMRPEVMRYTFPECVLCAVVDHQPSVLNKFFALGFLMAFTSGGLEKTLDDYPEFGRRVAQLQALRVRCAEYIVDGRFRDSIGIEVENTLAYVYESTEGLGVIMADTKNQEEKIRVALNPALLGHTTARQGILHRQDGSSDPAGKLLPDGRLCLEFTLPALEVAVWAVKCPRAANAS